MHAFDESEIVTGQNLSNQLDGKNSHVASNPIAIILYGGTNRGSAATKRIKYHVAFVRRGLNDPIEKRNWLLCRVAQPFCRDIVNWLHVSSYVLQRNT